MDSLYLKGNLALMNFTKQYYNNSMELLSSDDFKCFLNQFFDDLYKNHHALYVKVTKAMIRERAINQIIRMLKVLCVLELNEIEFLEENDIPLMLELVESGYHYWRDLQRYTLVYTRNSQGLLLANFMEADTDFNNMVLSFYRTIQQKLQGSNNQVYRQLQAGSNGSLLLCDVKWQKPQGYEGLNSILFVNKVMLRTPLILHPKSNKRAGSFTEVFENPVHQFSGNADEFMCIPCKVADSLTFIYFHRDFTSSAMGLANLFELANLEECETGKPDCIMLFGVQDNREETVFYHDRENQIWVGKISYAPIIEYFGYFKKMALTLHNLAMIEKGYLPIHGAMLNLYLKDGTKKGIVLMGDSGAGKSETIEAMTSIAKDQIDHQEIIFDDMGAMFLNAQGKVVCQGTEIGAFVRLDDLDKGSAYRDMDRSIFFNPESNNARVITPAAPYHVVVKEHEVDLFLYANNYENHRGLRAFDTFEQAKEVFVQGKRWALGTTSEKGLSTTYFANPFGPMQRQEQCDPIIDKMLHALFEQQVFVGEIYTCLGLADKGEKGIEIAAQKLIDLVKGK